MKKIRRVLVVLTAVLLPVLSAVAVSASVPAPFWWRGASWCPTEDAWVTCTGTLKPAWSDAAFVASHVRENKRHQIVLVMNASATVSGAFSSRVPVSYRPPVTMRAAVQLACTRSGVTENWPSFWLYSVGGSRNEIDIFEGLRGRVMWHVHYVNAAGSLVQKGGGGPGGSYCGWHTYKVAWTATSITVWYDGVRVGKVAESCAAPCISLGVPVPRNAMHLHFTYATNPRFGGPVAGSTVMRTAGFSAW